MKISIKSPVDNAVDALFSTEHRKAYVVIEYAGTLVEIVPTPDGLQIRAPHDRLVASFTAGNVVVVRCVPYEGFPE